MAGPTGTALYERFGRSYKIGKILDYCHKGLYAWSRSHGLGEPTLPRDLGGFGLPPRNKRESLAKCLSVFSRTRLASVVYRQKKRWHPSLEVQSAWVFSAASESRRMAEADLVSNWDYEMSRTKPGTSWSVRAHKNPPEGYLAIGSEYEHFTRQLAGDSAVLVSEVLGLDPPRAFFAHRPQEVRAGVVRIWMKCQRGAKPLHPNARLAELGAIMRAARSSRVVVSRLTLNQFSEPGQA